MESFKLALSLVLVILATCSQASKKLPSKFTRCRSDEPDLGTCLSRAMENALRVLKDGEPSLKILPIDPLKVTRISIKEGTDRPINLNLELTDIYFRGVSNPTVTNTKVDIENLIMEVKGFVPTYTLDADYEMTGKLLLLPLKGKGKVHINITHLEIKIDLNGVREMKKGEEYWKLLNLDLKVTNIKNMKINFDGLFNNDKLIGDSTNAAINENWQTFFDELKPSMEETFSSIFANVARQIFTQIPASELLPSN